MKLNKKNLKLINWALAVLIVLVLVKVVVWDHLPFFKKGKAKSEESDKKQPAVPVKVFHVQRFDFEDSLMALGTIKGRQEFKLSFEVPGIVDKINYKPGDVVEKGAAIISLKKEDIQLRIDRAQAQMKKAEADVKLAEERLKDNNKLFEIGAIPRSTLERVKLELDKAKYDFEVSNVELKASNVVMEKSTLLATEAGIIGDIFVEQGEAVTPNTLIGSLIVVSTVEAKFGVLEKDLPKVSVNQTAQVMVDAYPGRIFNGKISTVSKQVTGQTRTSDAWVAIENQDTNLLPGMFARIKVLVYKAKNVIAIPTEAIQKDEQGANYVYVVDLKKKIAAKKLVEVAYSRTDYSHVASGLTEDDWVATSGFDDLKDQSPVEVLEMQEKVF